MYYPGGSLNARPNQIPSSPKILLEPTLHIDGKCPPTVCNVLPESRPAYRQGCCTVFTREEGSVDSDEHANYVGQKQQMPYEGSSPTARHIFSRDLWL